MRILLVMDPGILVPPKGYGGHERLVFMFATEYLKMGHKVDLLVTEGSFVKGCQIYSIGKEGFPPKKREMNKALFKAWKFLLIRRKDYDVIHNFGRLLYLLPVLNCRVKKIMTYGREIDSRNINVINKLPNRNIIYTGCSENLIFNVKGIGNWKAVYNAIDFSKYNLIENVPNDAPLIFLGRIEQIKGCHTAIEVAKKTKRKLIIAGNISPLPDEQKYFREQIEPFIDGNQIQFIGQVNDEQKNHYLGLSIALLFPIEWEEPFGMVMVEAMACGTPVIGFKRGSVEEVIDEGVTGYKVTNVEEMILAINDLDKINRKSCCIHAQKRFDVPVIAQQYLNL